MAATIRQLNFINTLVAERDLPDQLKSEIFKICRQPDARPREDISPIIDELMKRPKRGAEPGRQRGFLADVPCARYVVERNEVPLGNQGVFGSNERVFIEVREFKGTRYMRQLHGAPGSFNRSKPDYGDQRALAAAVKAVGPLEATQRYSKLYSTCSVCGAELTDDRSVALGLGPDCRKRFGL